MKPRIAMRLVTLGIFVAVGGQGAAAGGSVNIPPPTGQFSETTTGEFAICLNPTTFAFESCATKGVLVLPFSFTAAGVEIRDSNGACVSRTNVSSSLPPNTQPPDIDSEVHIAVTVEHYDSSTGVGDDSFTNYDGGHCIGAKFDNTGATVTGSGTEHFVVSQSGRRIDGITTALTDPTDSFGSWTFNHVVLKQ